LEFVVFHKVILPKFQTPFLIYFYFLTTTEEQNRKIEKKEDMVILSKSKLLEEYFSKMPSKKERNCIIRSAYLDGYSQIEIANYLGLSKSLISKVIKSGDSTAGV